MSAADAHGMRGWLSLNSPLEGSTEPHGGGDFYKLLNSSFLLLQSIGGAFLEALFWRARSLAWARDMLRPRPSSVGDDSGSGLLSTCTHAFRVRVQFRCIAAGFFFWDSYPWRRWAAFCCWLGGVGWGTGSVGAHWQRMLQLWCYLSNTDPKNTTFESGKYNLIQSRKEI